MIWFSLNKLSHAFSAGQAQYLPENEITIYHISNMLDTWVVSHPILHQNENVSSCFLLSGLVPPSSMSQTVQIDFFEVVPHFPAVSRAFEHFFSHFFPAAHVVASRSRCRGSPMASHICRSQSSLGRWFSLYSKHIKDCEGYVEVVGMPTDSIL